MLAVPLSLLHQVWRLEFVNAACRTGGVGSLAQFAVRLALVFVIFSRVRLPASEAHSCMWLRAYVMAMSDFAARFAHLVVLPVEAASNQYGSVFNCRRHLGALEKHNYRGRAADPVRVDSHRVVVINDVCSDFFAGVFGGNVPNYPFGRVVRCRVICEHLVYLVPDCKRTELGV